MSENSEQRFLGTYEAGPLEQPSPVPHAWPLTPDQRALLATVDADASPRWRMIADRLRAIADDGRERFSARELYVDLVRGGEVEALIVHGLLVKHEYPSGAWQCGFTPYARSFYMAICTHSVPAEKETT